MPTIHRNYIESLSRPILGIPFVQRALFLQAASHIGTALCNLGRKALDAGEWSAELIEAWAMKAEMSGGHEDVALRKTLMQGLTEYIFWLKGFSCKLRPISGDLCMLNLHFKDASIRQKSSYGVNIYYIILYCVFLIILCLSLYICK